MILLVHLLFGAAVGSMVNNIPLAIILAFWSHYFLDLLPHAEYTVGSIKKNKLKKALPELLKILLDFSLGILLIFIFSKNYPVIYICAFFAILPDGFSVISNHFPNPDSKAIADPRWSRGKILAIHNKLHLEKIHFLKNKKISVFWRILSQVTVVIISLFLLKN